MAQVPSAGGTPNAASSLSVVTDKSKKECEKLPDQVAQKVIQETPTHPSAPPIEGDHAVVDITKDLKGETKGTETPDFNTALVDDDLTDNVIAEDISLSASSPTQTPPSEQKMEPKREEPSLERFGEYESLSQTIETSASTPLSSSEKPTGQIILPWRPVGIMPSTIMKNYLSGATIGSQPLGISSEEINEKQKDLKYQNVLAQFTALTRLEQRSPDNERIEALAGAINGELIAKDLGYDPSEFIDISNISDPVHGTVQLFKSKNSDQAYCPYLTQEQVTGVKQRLPDSEKERLSSWNIMGFTHKQQAEINKKREEDWKAFIETFSISVRAFVAKYKSEKASHKKGETIEGELETRFYTPSPVSMKRTAARSEDAKQMAVRQLWPKGSLPAMQRRQAEKAYARQREEDEERREEDEKATEKKTQILKKEVKSFEERHSIAESQRKRKPKVKP